MQVSVGIVFTSAQIYLYKLAITTVFIPNRLFQLQLLTSCLQSPSSGNMSSIGLRDLPKINLKFPSTPLVNAAFEYSKEYTSEGTWKHTARSAYFAAILANKLPQFAKVDLEVVIVSCILHDLGWALDPKTESQTLRFEVDGAEKARSWLNEQFSRDDTGAWSGRRVQLLWDAIALHTTGSIALYKEPEVALTHLAIGTDFRGPAMPLPGAITAVEFKEVIRTFPRVNFNPKAFRRIMCGLCERKPQTTFDNFVSLYGVRFGMDGEGKGRDEFAKQYNAADPVDRMLGSLESVEYLVREVEAEGSE